MCEYQHGLGMPFGIFFSMITSLTSLEDSFSLDRLGETGLAFPLHLDAHVFRALQHGMDWESAARDGIGARRLLDTHLVNGHFDSSGSTGSAVAAVAASSEVVNAAAASLNVTVDNVALISSDIFCKPPGQVEAFVGWHQDQSWWGVHPIHSLANVWIALDKSDADTGCVRYLPGSHLDAIIHPHEDRVPGNQLLLSVNVSDAKAASAICVELHPGHFVVFSGLIVHSSAPNKSKRRRCGLVLRFTVWPALLKQEGYVVGEKVYHPTPIRISAHSRVQVRGEL